MSRRKPRSTCLWPSVRDLWDELATGALCLVPHTVQSIHPGVGNKRGQSTYRVSQFGSSPACLTYEIIWFRRSPAHFLGWGKFTEAVGRKAGKPDISSSMMDAHISPVLGTGDAVVN